MLKKVILNNRTVPVPVPIKSLGEAIAWVEETLLRKDQMITKVLVDKREVDDPRAAAQADAKLTVNSRLEIQIDSPTDLSIQSLEALKNLATVVEGILKPLAVECWGDPSSVGPREVDSLHADLSLIKDLVAHFLSLVELDNGLLRTIEEASSALGVILKSLETSRQQGNWKEYARILLNQLEPLVGEMIMESGNLQAMVFSARLQQPTPVQFQRKFS